MGRNSTAGFYPKVFFFIKKEFSLGFIFMVNDNILVAWFSTPKIIWKRSRNYWSQHTYEVIAMLESVLNMFAFKFLINHYRLVCS